MIYRLDINYSEEERYFLEVNDCEIISEIKLSKTNFSDKEIPRRMIKYGGQYIAEIVDEAKKNINKDYFFIIDEINRGNFIKLERDLAF